MSLYSYIYVEPPEVSSIYGFLARNTILGHCISSAELGHIAKVIHEKGYRLTPLVTEWKVEDYDKTG